MRFSRVCASGFSADFEYVAYAKKVVGVACPSALAVQPKPVIMY
jgi:hypothetical protein